MATQTDSSLACDCNLEQFEERLGAVEHGLKTSSEATKEWSKRIEQAEVCELLIDMYKLRTQYKK